MQGSAPGTPRRGSRDAGGANGPAELVARNIDHVLSIEDGFVRNRSTAEAVSDAIGGFVGTLWFAALHVVAILCWVLANTGHLAGMRAFDPYPFSLLSTIVSSEAVVLSAFVLMKQNRMSKVGDRRDHLDLQVNLLAEQEASLIIQMLDRIGHKLGVDAEDQAAAVQLSRTATLEHLVKELHRRLPDSTNDLPGPASG